MAEDVLHLHTTLSVEAIKEIFGSTLQLSRKVEFGTVPGGDDPFARNADFQAYASLKTALGGWLVQIYVTDRTDGREVQLVAAGSSALGRAWKGLRNAYSLSDSREKAAAVRERLSSADPGLRVA
ncbi:hypothetical protein AB0E77_23590 [Streptomyces sp. NPDC032940]|uniref:hypothetical protein n=1 Tax=Streptomyces sp. NPDC032940 TaxID=3155366 RepID=UPI00340B5B1D